MLLKFERISESVGWRRKSEHTPPTEIVKTIFITGTRLLSSSTLRLQLGRELHKESGLTFQTELVAFYTLRSSPQTGTGLYNIMGENTALKFPSLGSFYSLYLTIKIWTLPHEVQLYTVLFLFNYVKCIAQRNYIS